MNGINGSMHVSKSDLGRINFAVMENPVDEEDDQKIQTLRTTSEDTRKMI